MDSKFRLSRSGLLLLLLAAGAGACVSARMSDREPDRLFRAGQYDAAASHLGNGLKQQGEDGRDLLLYVLDHSLALHTAGKLSEAIQGFRRADQLAEIKDYTSLASESASILTSDNLRDYKAEDFENVLISAYLAMDYALLGQGEDAQVEARRVNRKLYLMATEGGRKYQQNAFARYLSSILHEADRDWNAAYIDLKEAHKLTPLVAGLGRDLWRLAVFNGFADEAERWADEYQLTEEDKAWSRSLHPRKGKAELIVIYENGIAPQKVPNPNFRTLPVFVSRPNPVSSAAVRVDGRESGHTAILYDIDAIARQNLEEKYAGLIARRVGGIVAREVIGDQVSRRTNNEGLGFLVKLLLNASDQADLRSWSLLPHDLQLLRIAVDPGTHVVRLEPIGDASQSREKTVQVKAGSKAFVSFRYLP